MIQNPLIRCAITQTICVLVVMFGALVEAGQSGDEASSPAATPTSNERRQVIMENPWIMTQLSRGGGFGNTFSPAIANYMYSRSHAAALTDSREQLRIESYGDRTWVLRLPMVNVAVLETDDGLVLVDSGYAPAGPAIRDALKTISAQPVHTIILTHHHIDHALGAWALQGGANRPEIIASEEFVRQQQRDLDLGRYMTRRNHQDPSTSPRGWEEVVAPTRTFNGTLDLKIGNEHFVLTHARGETSDQLYVHVPERDLLVSADYYQRFIPNAGNGRRPQRYVKEWSEALGDMADLQAHIMIPMHGEVLTDADEIQDRLRSHAEILSSIDQQVRTALSAGTAEYRIAESVVLPPQNADRDDVDELYVSVQDVAKMVIAQYTGWWDDLPSHWNAAPLREQAVETVALAGGVDAFLARAVALQDSNIRLACNLLDVVWLAEPTNPRVLTQAYQTYLQRLRTTGPLQEALVYLDHLGTLRIAMNRLGLTSPVLQVN